MDPIAGSGGPQLANFTVVSSVYDAGYLHPRSDLILLVVSISWGETGFAPLAVLRIAARPETALDPQAVFKRCAQSPLLCV